MLLKECISYAQAVVDGYNACVICFGGNRTGKNFTANGESGSVGLLMGIVEEIFTLKEKRQGYSYEMFATYVEIFNDKIYDLTQESGGGGPSECDAGEGGEVGVRKAISEAGDVETLVANGEETRGRWPDYGDRRTQGHTVLTVIITQKNDGQNTQFEGSLMFAKLGATARNSSADAESSGGELPAGQMSNKGLIALEGTMQKLQKRNANKLNDQSVDCGFAASALTKVLKRPLDDTNREPDKAADKDHCSSHASTLLILNMSPSVKEHEETMENLRWAAGVRGMAIGPPQQQRVDGGDMLGGRGQVS